jgi:methionyl-tRNA formyltransferase
VKTSIVFMGTPDFAVPPLHALHAAGCDVSLVVTQPDRPKGRGRSLAAPPVKQAAQQLGFAVAQPAKIREPAFVARLQDLRPDFMVVVAFGQILPVSVLKIPRHGAINIHGSLLPKYRGPAPVQWAMIRGEQKTGVTTMLMDSGVDTGDILLRAETAIGPNDTADTLLRRLSRMGAELLMDTLAQLKAGTLFPRAQRHDDATYAPMLKKGDGHVRWHQPAGRLDAFVRAMTPWPGAFCLLNGKRLKILKAHAAEETLVPAPPGTVVPGFPDELRIATNQGVLFLDEIQSESGKRLPIKDFLRGHPLPPGTVLT